MFEYQSLRELFNDEHLCIALVGGGGKTSTMYGLARIFANENKRVLVTTTTRIFAPNNQQCDNFSARDRLNNISIPAGKIYGYGADVNEKNKVTGYDIGVIEEAEELGSKIFDILIYEADGAKRLPLKAPNETEPCIAQNSTHTIACVGLDSLGKPLNEDIAFRVELFTKITGCGRDDIIEPKHIQKILEHKNGLFQYTPSSAKRIVLLTKADDESRIFYAKEIQKLLAKSDNWNGSVLWI